uniref:Hypothetical conserved protein n=1 Tax=uncultured marine virus TaxID=186617 RepID=A0A0F7L9R8_9VIRU|nr:hypothetical conserved protein [uncultured marine virus]
MVFVNTVASEAAADSLAVFFIAPATKKCSTSNTPAMMDRFFSAAAFGSSKPAYLIRSRISVHCRRSMRRSHSIAIAFGTIPIRSRTAFLAVITLATGVAVA